MQRTDFAVLLKRYRRRVHLSQRELAHHAGYSREYVGMLERGVRLPSHAARAVLAAALSLEGPERETFLAMELPAAEPGTLVGREVELAAIDTHLQGGGPPLLLVQGVPGIGKTRLLQEARCRAQRRGMTVLSGTAYREGSEPLSPFVEALEQSIRAQPPADHARLVRTNRWLIRLLPELSELGVEAPSALPAGQERRQMVRGLARYFAQVAGPGGTLLLLDDLHWASGDALDFMAALLRTPGSPLRILGAYRDTEMAIEDRLGRLAIALGRADLASSLKLQPLPPVEAGRLLDSFLPRRKAEAGRRTRAIERSGGVPLYVISLARALMAGSDDVPWELAAAVRQRVLDLSPAGRAVLAVLAILGRNAPRRLIHAGSDLPEAEVLIGLAEAERSGLIEDAGPHSYRFSHDVIADAVATFLPSGHRAALHRRVLDAMEGAGTAAELAYHAVRSDEPERAVRYLQLAGDAAWEQHANQAAAEYYRELVARLARLGRNVGPALERLGEVLNTTGSFQEAVDVLERAAALYRSRGDRESEVRAVTAIGWVHFRRGTAHEGVRRLAALLDEVGEMQLHGVPGLWSRLACLYGTAGDFRAFHQTAIQVVHSARGSKDPRALADALLNRGASLVLQGESGKGMATLEEAAAVAKQAAAPDILWHILWALDALSLQQGNFDCAGDYNDQLVAVAEELDDSALLALAFGLRGQRLYAEKRWREAREWLERAVALARATSPSYLARFAFLPLVALEIAEGNRAEARQLLAEAEAVAEVIGDIPGRAEIRCRQAELDVLNGHAQALALDEDQSLGLAREMHQSLYGDQLGAD